MVALGDLSGGTFTSFAQAISADGTTVVGYSSSSNNNQAFRWTQPTGMVGLGELPGGSVFSYANSVSADGGVVVGESSSTLSGTIGGEAFRWTPTNGMIGLGDLPGGNFDSHAYAVSADGTVIIGNSSSSNGNEAFRWTAATGMVGLNDLADGNFSSIAYGISADGSTIVGYGSPPSNVHEAFRRTTATGMVGLGFLPCDTWTIARAVSGDGSAIVGDPQASTCRCVFIWDAQHGLRELLNVLTNNYGLNLAGWQLCRATALSYDGNVIVGYGVNPSGQTEAWIANIAPPSLSISREGSNIVLSWATNAPGFMLQSANNLILSNWVDSTTVPVIAGTEFTVMHGTSNSAQFYRLKK
jgi:probable HAF family extracellular repeat protein